MTFRTYTEDTENHHAMVEIPTVEGQSDNPVYNESIQAINEDVEALTSTLIAQFEADAADLGDEGHTALEVRHKIVTNSDTWFTLEMEVWQGSGSSNTYYRYYHIDKNHRRDHRSSPTSSRTMAMWRPSAKRSSGKCRRPTTLGTGVFWIDSEYDGLNFKSMRSQSEFLL